MQIHDFREFSKSQPDFLDKIDIFIPEFDTSITTLNKIINNINNMTLKSSTFWNLIIMLKFKHISQIYTGLDANGLRLIEKFCSDFDSDIDHKSEIYMLIMAKKRLFYSLKVISHTFIEDNIVNLRKAVNFYD